MIASWLALNSAGCATIGGRHQIVAVDSDPRGAAVASDGTTIGTTPLFYEQKRGPGHQLGFGNGKDGKPLAQQRIECDYRWALQGLGNGALTLMVPLLGVLGFATDYVTGAAFECPDRIYATLPTASGAKVNYCRRYLVAPPPQYDDALGTELVRQWRESALFQLRACDRIIPFAQTKSYFDYLNWQKRGGNDEVASNTDTLNYLGFHTNATHLVLLHEKESAAGLQIHSDVVDMLTGKRVSDLQSDIPLKNPDQFKLTAGDRVLSYTVSLMPNSITFGGSRATYEIEAANGLRVVSTEEVEALIPYLSEWGLTTVEHPDGYNTWDFTWTTYPSFSASLLERRVELENIEPPTNRHHRNIVLFSMIPTYNVGITLHTAIGAFSTALGAGFAVTRLKASSEEARFDMKPAAVSETLYTAFLTKHIFLQAGGKNINFSPPRSAEVKFKGSFYEPTARLGYFYPIRIP